MVIILAKTSFLTEEEVKDVKEKMIEFFSKPVGSVNVSSLYLSTREVDKSSIDSFEHLGGYLNSEPEEQPDGNPKVGMYTKPWHCDLI